jgi:hypothetical protein
MEPDQIRWAEVEAAVRRLLAVARDSLPADAVLAVEHYLEHSEFEMAFEGLLLEIMQAFPNGFQADWPYYESLATGLKLDVESVFDGEFWSKFVPYIAREKRGP